MSKRWSADYKTMDAVNEMLASNQAALREAERETEDRNAVEGEARLAVLLSQKDVRITSMALELQARHDHIEYQRSVINWLRRLPEVDKLFTSLERGLEVKIRDENNGEFPCKLNGASAFHQRCVEMIKEMREEEEPPPSKPKCEQCNDLGADPECTLCCKMKIS